jgi:hypothetical protein
MPDPEPNFSPSPARLLKGAAVLFAVLGASFLVWIVDTWMEHPETQATQFGFEAPLWPALGGFVLLAIGAVGSLFWTAAERVEAGDDLFGHRHRRRASDWEENGKST